MLYFGGLEGINWFNPKELTFNMTQPKTIISKIEIFHKEQALVQNKEYKNGWDLVDVLNGESKKQFTRRGLG